MRALTGERLLAAWDQGMEEHDLNRALTMLTLALPESNRRQLAELSIAERNLLLLHLRELSFGPVLRGFGLCPQCNAPLEFAAPVASLVAHLEDLAPAEPVAWSEGGRQYRLRAINTGDLLASLDTPAIEDAQDRLLARCLTVSPPQPEDALASPAAMPAVPAMLERLDRLHTAAELSCAVECPTCSSKQTLDVDIARFLWLEVRNAAQRLLREIHELAGAYGWSERAIARMSAQRRSAYLEMLTA